MVNLVHRYPHAQGELTEPPPLPPRLSSLRRSPASKQPPELRLSLIDQTCASLPRHRRLKKSNLESGIDKSRQEEEDSFALNESIQKLSIQEKVNLQD